VCPPNRGERSTPPSKTNWFHHASTRSAVVSASHRADRITDHE